MLKQRILTALILAPLAIAAIFYLPINYFGGFILAVMAIGAWEWGPLMGVTGKAKRWAFVISTALLIAVFWWYQPLEQIWLINKKPEQAVLSVLWLAVIWWILSAVLTYMYPKLSKFWSNNRAIRGVFGLLTLVPTWLAFMVLRTHDYSLERYSGAQLIMLLFLIVWSADVGAYFVGKAFGKHKLLPNVSPGKTIEGFLGGIVFSCLMVVLAGYIVGWNSTQFTTVLMVTILMTTVSVLGDLNESMFKRQAGVKDSGTLLPGHGGILDRIDSLTATAPIYALCYIMIGW